MRLKSKPSTQADNTADSHLTYCLNIHAGESWPEVFQAIRTFPLQVKKHVAGNQSFGLGLRLGRRAVDEILASGGMNELRAFLKDNGLYVFTLNGFPYGVFHGTAVKDSVYRPDWTSPDRRDYTLLLARLLAGLLPPDMDGSISTVPLSYRPWNLPADAVIAMARNLADVAMALADYDARQGCELHLGLEPEPDCWLETSADVIKYFNQHLIPGAIPRIRQARGCTADAAEVLFRRHIGVCVDTCHLSLQYERPAESLVALNNAGIRISKVQLSAALKTSPTPETLSQLARFSDPVYLHQVKAQQADGPVVSLGDLQPALAAVANDRAGETAGEWRVHCHVPLHFSGGHGLSTTRDDLDAGFFQTIQRLGIRHLEIETYTYDVLPDDTRERNVVANIAAEYDWVLEQWREGR